MSLTVICNSPVLTAQPTFTLNADVSGWTHTIEAEGGFAGAAFRMSMNRNDAEDFFYNALRRHVTRYDPDGQTVAWEGLIDEVTLDYGVAKITLSMTGVANRVIAQYRLANHTPLPPISERRGVKAGAINDTTSQGLYGILQANIVLGRSTSAFAGQAQQIFLTEHAYPHPLEQFSIGAGTGGGVGVAVKCKGYYYTLDESIYKQTATSGSQNADTTIDAILVASGSFIGGCALTTNTMQAPSYFNDGQTALAVVEQLVGAGDITNARWIAAVYDNRKFFYRPASTQVDYWWSLTDERNAIFDINGSEISPWLVRPDRWMRNISTKSMKLVDTVTRADPQMRYIERVTYTEPWGLTLEGSLSTQWESLMAQRALRGAK